ncbi:DUF7935 family protein [Pedobacter insulae]|uniref:Uncharacterized protein n=1 Tax=Pedobacter insulae TaxID=414048 RepID=A0A1I2TTJ4_9SPHI|nr:hypothetical protein [Pedobacter insulae]SFG67539.1 hypothetical protein SAMN04489864_101553 [Pedobacter insulae]
MYVKQIFIDLMVLSLGIFIPLMAIYYVVKGDIMRFFNLKTIELNQVHSASLLPLRLQAHERLIIFIDRINPANLLIRLHHQGIGIKELQNLVINDIKSEFQHNVAQQLYINATSWQVIRKLKDDTLAMVNNAVLGLPESANGTDLSKKVLQHMAGIPENPYDLTIEHLKKDIQELF